MLTPSSVRIVEPPIGTYKVEIASELERHIKVCIQAQFTGRLDLNLQGSQKPQWSLFFRSGSLVWSVSEVHPIRRWSRLLFQYCPQLAAASSASQGNDRLRYWDYEALSQLVRRREIQPKQLEAIAFSSNVEILFDIIQTVHQLRHLSHRPGMQLLYRRAPQEMANHMLVSVQADQAWLQAWQLWKGWLQAGLADFSPNLAPVVWDADELRQQTSLLVYHNLTTLADGYWTMRDLSVKLQQPMLSLAESIAPYVNQGVMGLDQVEDIHYSVQAATTGALVAYIEDSRFDSTAMSNILSRAGYRYINIRDSTQALPMLLEHKPDVILLDLIMPVANGYEVCAQIRRVSAFKNTPVIIVTSSDGLVDRVRAKLVGSSGFIAKPISPEKVLPTVRQHLSGEPLANSSG
jgi:two-component system, chemotaxis family, response regulator PixG